MMLVDELKRWITMAKLDGGIEDQDTIAAITAATNYCWSLYDRRSVPRTDEAQLGIKWIAALMVSDVKSDAADISAITAPARIRRATFFRASVHHKGCVAEILREAAAVSDTDSDKVMTAAGATMFISPTGRGKGFKSGG